MRRQLRGQQGGGNTMAGHIDGENAGTFVIDMEKPDQIAADLATGPQQQRQIEIAQPGTAFAHKSLLQLARLGQIAGHFILRGMQLFQRLLQHGIAGAQILFEMQNAFAGGQPGKQFGAGNGLGQKIVGPRFQPIGDIGLIGFRCQQHEIAISFPR